MPTLLRFTVIAVLIAFPCLPAAAQPAPQTGVQQMSWLAGCWRHLNQAEGSQEQWMAPAGNLMLGMSRTLRSGREPFFEYMRLEQSADNQLIFVAQPGGKQEVRFTLNQQQDNLWVFENLRNDFPQRISYQHTSADRTDAVISGQVETRVQSVRFPMQRINCREQ